MWISFYAPVTSSVEEKKLPAIGNSKNKIPIINIANPIFFKSNFLFFKLTKKIINPALPTTAPIIIHISATLIFFL